MKRWMVKSRRIFALLMAVMMLSLFDVPDGRGNVSLAAQAEDKESVELLASGSCGTSANWEFYSDGELRITGTGEMSFDTAPWKDYRKRIIRVVIATGITTLGSAGHNGAFEGCSNLTDIEIPDSVTGLGNYTFQDCSSLTSIKIPVGVTNIGVYTFGRCSSLKGIEIPTGVTNIGRNAFSYCTSLTSIEIPDSVTNIGRNAFSYCSSLESIEVAEENSNYDSRDNCNAIIETSSNELITGCKNTKIPNSVTSIRNQAFEGCVSLTGIEIPDSVTAIGREAFSKCTSLTGVNIPKSVTSINNSAFNYCSSLENIEVAEENSNYDSRENCNAIIEKTSNKLIIGCKSTKIPESVTAIGNAAFYFCSSLISLEIPNGVTSIEDYAFTGCTSLININIPAGVPDIGNGVFYGCSSLTSIEIPNGVTSIGNEAFYGCSSLAGLYIPASITKIGAHVYKGCSGLKRIEVAEGNTVYDSRDNCNAIIETSSNNLITGCKNTIIPESVTGIGKSAFAYNSGLTSIEIPAGVTKIEMGGFGAFVGCSGLERIEVAEGNTVYDSRDNCNAIIETSSNNLLAGCTATVIPDSVTGIGDYAFGGCSSLTRIEIPNGVTSIGNEAFYGCSSLTIWGLPGSYAEDYAEEEGIPFKIMRFDVQFVSDGQIIDTQSVEYGKAAESPEVVKEGYTLSGWDKDFTEIKADTTVNAVWTINQYQITFKDGDKVLDTQTVEYGKTATAPTVAPKEGYTLSWDKDFAEIKADTTVNAVWTARKNQDQDKDQNQDQNNQNQNQNLTNENMTGNTKQPAKQYTVQFDKNGGSKVSKPSITVTYNDKYGALPKAVRKKYTFLGWYTAKSGGSAITSSTKVSAAKNHTLYARWTKVKTRKASIKKVKAGKRKMTVTLGKVSGAKGYQIVYSANKKFKSAKKVRVTSTKTVIKKLKRKKTIYVKVRAYKKDSAGSKVYGKFSSVKRVKIK